MSFRIYNTQKWSAEQMAPYLDKVIKSIAYFHKKFPDDYTPQTILNDILKGDKLLWIIVDEQENFMAHVTTELQKLVTGALRAVIVTLGGKGGAPLTKLIPQIEAYYKEKGAKELIIIGRRGWKKSLKSHGYFVNLLEYRKQL
ncbi:hypothetical protein BH09320 [Bartonella henselae str. Houston-1]|uniref:Uncharacterized protein n=2 Tax=Bartonella TaxID=773 RepID=A0A0H3LWX8_BARHE|nr:hypothetical protein [Bartonella henselae]MDM9983742.1 hypothetical protein [Bartonella henselae]MDM9986799.1 hypothetical protein [Bartonella henselae]MDM9991424.1 hypothetical protein [Bartonella henselae]MDM9995092.1 hypothetical protein [Bartonella henselae]MDM9999255.1 hypothetical protein [Bartonella henselae]